jgi:hypothetical protein
VTIHRFVLCALAALFAAAPSYADEHLVPTPGGDLDGKTVVISPGHGRMFTNGAWRWQRPLLHDIREDIHTNEIMIEVVQRYLSGAGARIEFCRERSFQSADVADLDDAAATTTGTWTVSSNVRPFFGTGYRYARSQATETATATFTPDVPVAGRYPVYVRWTQGSDRARDALYRVHHTGGVTEVRLAQNTGGNHWRFLGDFHFTKGKVGRIVLSNKGSDTTKVVVVDGVRLGGGVGPSGLNRWREGAKAFLTHKGFASTRGEVTVRPAYATALAGGSVTSWRDDYRYVALHTNAGGGTGTSAFSFGNGRGGVGPAGYHTTNPTPLYLASDRLRDLIVNAIVDDVRALVDPTWRNRGGGTANFGELREARNMPSTLVELAFHDHAGDSARLRDPSFRHLAGRAIYKGILRSFVANPTVSPLAPSGLRLENLGGGKLRVTFDAVNDPLEPSAVPTGFKVYVSPNGFGFDGGRSTTQTSLVLDGLTPGETVYVKVSATNSGGEGLATRVGGALVAEPTKRALVVDGFDRLYGFTHDNGERRYTYDYCVEHVETLAMVLPAGAAIDYAENEAVGPGGIDLAGYEFVDWLLGREASATRTFDTSEQSAVDAYLAGGGKLLVTGTEIAWDLGAQSGGKAFLEGTLGATYVGDDANTRVARGAAGSRFAQLGPFDFGRGRYDVASPDVFGVAPGAEALFAYETAGVPTAGVGIAKRVIVLAFPLEAIADPAQRVALTRAALDFVEVDLSAPATTTTPPLTPSGGTGGGGTAPTTSTTAPGSTAPSGSSRRRSSGGCSLSLESAPGGWPACLLLCALLSLRRRF